MTRRISVFFLAFAAAISLTACEKGVIYYNDYFGLTVSVKDKYIIEILDSSNLSQNKADTAALTSLSLQEDEDGFGVYWFITMENGSDPDTDSYAMLTVVAEPKEYYESVSDFISCISALYDYENPEYGVTCEESGNYSLNGREARKISVYTKYYFEDISFYNEIYVTELPDVYLYVYLFYWDKNETSKKSAYEMLSCVTIK